MEARLEQIEKAPKRSRRNTTINIAGPKSKDFDDLRQIKNPLEVEDGQNKKKRTRRNTMHAGGGAGAMGAGGAQQPKRDPIPIQPHTPTLVGKDMFSTGADGMDGNNLVGRGTEVTQNINLSPIVGTNDNSAKALIQQ